MAERTTMVPYLVRTNAAGEAPIKQKSLLSENHTMRKM